MTNIGSIWSKWDLHVHTPFSYLNNQFGNDWDNYVQLLFKKAIEKKVKVIGMTDYFSIDGYKKIKNEYLNNSEKLNQLFSQEEIIEVKNILIIPNVEFRLNKIIGTNRINFHVLFSPEIQSRDIEENFLHEIDFSFQGNPYDQEEKWKLKTLNIENLGKKLKEQHTNFRSNSDIFIGMMNAVVDDNQLLQILSSKKSIFKEKYLICLPADEDLSQIKWDSQDHLTRKVLIQKSNLILSSNPKTRRWGIGGDTIEERKNFIKEFKSVKPCIWGSDAHEYDKLFEPDKQRYLWVKADPTFDGLRQILYEPSKRVLIQKDNPEFLSKKLRIDKIKISNCGIFPIINQELPLNRDLVCIIGGRGSGKSAILETLSFCFGKNKTSGFDSGRRYDSGGKFDSPKQFIEHYKSLGCDVQIELSYYDLDNNQLDPFITSLQSKVDDCPYPLLYLGQNQIEEYSFDKNKIHELAFEAVIKNSSLSDEFTSIEAEIKSNEAELISANKDVEASRLHLQAFNIDKINLEKEKLLKELQLLSSDSTKTILDTLNLNRERRDRLNKSIGLIDQINKQISGFEERVSPLIGELQENVVGMNINSKVEINLEISKNNLNELLEILKQSTIISEYEVAIKEAQVQLEGKTDVSVSYIESLKSRLDEINKDFEMYKKEKEYLSFYLQHRFDLLLELKELYEEYSELYANSIEEFSHKHISILDSAILLFSHMSKKSMTFLPCC